MSPGEIERCTNVDAESDDEHRRQRRSHRSRRKSSTNGSQSDALHTCFLVRQLCTLRHITARHDLENEAREIIRKSYGIGTIVKLLRDKNFIKHWEIIKATVGLIKNLALTPTMIPYLCEQNAVRRLIELFTCVDRERSKLTDDHHRYQQQWDTLLNLIVGALTHLAKDSSCKSIMKDMNCPSMLLRVSRRRSVRT
jgi:hypothetical protein